MEFGFSIEATVPREYADFRVDTDNLREELKELGEYEHHIKPLSNLCAFCGISPHGEDSAISLILIPLSQINDENTDEYMSLSEIVDNLEDDELTKVCEYTEGFDFIVCRYNNPEVHKIAVYIEAEAFEEFNLGFVLRVIAKEAIRAFSRDIVYKKFSIDLSEKNRYADMIVGAYTMLSASNYLEADEYDIMLSGIHRVIALMNDAMRGRKFNQEEQAELVETLTYSVVSSNGGIRRGESRFSENKSQAVLDLDEAFEQLGHLCASIMDKLHPKCIADSALDKSELNTIGFKLKTINMLISKIDKKGA